MKIAISVHSHKGGTGKTMFAINLASEFVSRGYRVAVLDLDLGAPSLQTYAPGRLEATLNDYFLGNAELRNVIFDATYLLGDKGKGKLFLGLASIDSEKISAIQHRDKQAQLNDLYLIMGLVRNKLPNDPWNVDIIILDTSPGISTNSINCIAASNHMVVLIKMINGDLQGTLEMLKTLNKTLNLETSVIVNQIPEFYKEFGGEEKITAIINEELLAHIDHNSKIEYKGHIVADDSIMRMETGYAFSIMEGENRPRPIHILENPDSTHSKKIREFCDQLIERMER